MEKKIRLTRKVFTISSFVVVPLAFALAGKYGSAIGLSIGYAIGMGLRKKQPDPDERELLQELFSNYIAGFVVLAFLVIMMARESSGRMFDNPYFQVLIVWLVGWFSSVFVVKKVWK